MTEFINVSKAFGQKTVLDRFSLHIESGEKVAVMGESGSGKTTLLRIAAGLLSPDSGEFHRDGGFALMFQEPRLLPWKTARENICAVLSKESRPLADKYLAAVGLADAADQLPRSLSGGMAQRVSFARFLAYAEESGASLLLLDEPFSALDKETARQMQQLLRDFAKDKALLLVTHSEADAHTLCDRIVTISA